jgi:hypothetical protein
VADAIAPPIFSALPRDEVRLACGRQANGFYVHSRHDKNFSECERAAGFGGDTKHGSLLPSALPCKIGERDARCSLFRYWFELE